MNADVIRLEIDMQKLSPGMRHRLVSALYDQANRESIQLGSDVRRIWKDAEDSPIKQRILQWERAASELAAELYQLRRKTAEGTLKKDW